MTNQNHESGEANVVYDTKLGFLGSGEDIFVRVQWERGKVELISQLLLSLVTGNAFTILWEYIEKYAESIDDQQGLLEIKKFLNSSMKQNTGNDDPMIRPINAIHRMLTMYHEQ